MWWDGDGMSKRRPIDAPILRGKARVAERAMGQGKGGEGGNEHGGGRREGQDFKWLEQPCERRNMSAYTWAGFPSERTARVS